MNANRDQVKDALDASPDSAPTDAVRFFLNTNPPTEVSLISVTRIGKTDPELPTGASSDPYHQVLLSSPA